MRWGCNSATKQTCWFFERGSARGWFTKTNYYYCSKRLVRFFYILHSLFFKGCFYYLHTGFANEEGAGEGEGADEGEGAGEGANALPSEEVFSCCVGLKDIFYI